MNKVTVLSTTPSTINDAAYEMPDRFSVEIVPTVDGKWKVSGLGFEATDSSKSHALAEVNRQVRDALKAKAIHF